MAPLAVLTSGSTMEHPLLMVRLPSLAVSFCEVGHQFSCFLLPTSKHVHGAGRPYQRFHPGALAAHGATAFG